MAQMFPNDGFLRQFLGNAQPDANHGRRQDVIFTLFTRLGSSDKYTVRAFTATISSPTIPRNTSAKREAEMYGCLSKSLTSD